MAPNLAAYDFAKHLKALLVADALQDYPGPMGIQTGAVSRLARSPHPGT
jgi:hypothetical protein